MHAVITLGLSNPRIIDTLPLVLVITFNNLISMGAFVMGARRNGQEGALAPLPLEML